MNKEAAVSFLFTISKEIRRSYETPVILLTLRDYAENIFDSLIQMRNLLMQNSQHEQIIDEINTLHFRWLQAVQDIENFKKRVKQTSRDFILKTIDFTMECVRERHSYFQRYIEQQKPLMRWEQQNLMQAEIETIGDMRELVNYALLEKQRSLCNQSDKADFYVIIDGEIEELMNWLDKLNDHLVIEFIKIIDLKVPIAPSDLVKTLENIIDESASCGSKVEVTAKEVISKGELKGAYHDIRNYNICGLNMASIVEKIKNLEDRLDRLKMKDSLAAMAIEHKTVYLEERLQSLQNLKTSLNYLKFQRNANRKGLAVKESDMQIFNHFLPNLERCHLVERLVKLWNTAIGGDRKRKSIITIFSATDIKEVFSDELGRFCEDKYGRKIYSLDDDIILYQRNESNTLVPVNDEKHIYFYDNCGRYYLNDSQERIYKAHTDASEYLLNRAGFLLKVGEFEGNVEYRYDALGRYYVNEKGVRIYKDQGSEEEYIHDDLGNLVLIHRKSSKYIVCPREPIVMEENVYLVESVGEALKKCIAAVALAQPLDPIKNLADRLEKYHRSSIVKQKMLLKSEELMTQRELDRVRASRRELEAKPVSLTDYGEASTIDLNLTQYQTMLPDF